MPLDSILCLDTSGSMAGFKLTQLKQAANSFVDGAEQMARQTGLMENIAVVEFGSHTRVVIGLGNNYAAVRRAINSLSAGGSTPMAKGLLFSLKEIVEHGGVVRIAGAVSLTPRIILVTDGEPTDDNNQGGMPAKEEVLKIAVLFGPAAQQVGLPFPVPICAIGVGGDCDTRLLEVMAEVTNGMYRQVNDARELGDFFRQQVLLIMFIIRFGQEMDQLRNLLALRAFLEEHGEHLTEEEAAALLIVVLAMTQQGGRPSVPAPQRQGQRLALTNGGPPAQRGQPSGYRGQASYGTSGGRGYAPPSRPRDDSSCLCCSIL